MATGTIKTNRAMEEGTITYIKTLGSGTLNQYSCQKINGVVNACARVYGISEPASGQWFRLPEGFRPRARASGIGYIYTTSSPNIAAVLPCHVWEDGYVELTYTSSQTATQVGFAITFPV